MFGVVGRNIISRSKTLSPYSCPTVTVTPKHTSYKQFNTIRSFCTKTQQDIQKKEVPHLVQKSGLIGLTMGTFGGMVGLGGGVIAIPMLTSWTKLTQHEAHGTSLAAVTATGINHNNHQQ